MALVVKGITAVANLAETNVAKTYLPGNFLRNLCENPLGDTQQVRTIGTTIIYNPLSTRGDFLMSQWNIAAKSKEEQDKVNVDLAASGVAYKERLNMPVVAEVVAREQPEHLREYYLERVRYNPEWSEQLPRAFDPRYIEMEEASKK